MVEKSARGSVILFRSRHHLRVYGGDRRLQAIPSGVKQQQAPPEHERSDASCPIRHAFLETTFQAHEPRCHVTHRSCWGPTMNLPHRYQPQAHTAHLATRAMGVQSAFSSAIFRTAADHAGLGTPQRGPSIQTFRL
jgi:hypothetical protein